MSDLPKRLREVRGFGEMNAVLDAAADEIEQAWEELDDGKETIELTREAVETLVQRGLDALLSKEKPRPRTAPEPDLVLESLRQACECSLDAIRATNRADRLEGKIRNALLIADGPGFGECDGDMEDVLGLLRVAVGEAWAATTREAGR